MARGRRRCGIGEVAEAVYAGLNRRRHDRWRVAVDQLRTLLPRVVAVLAPVLEGGEGRARVAVAILWLVDLDRAKAPEKLDTLLIGPTARPTSTIS